MTPEEIILGADKVNVIDVEAACWLGHPPPGQEKEIIEIGIAQVTIRPELQVGKRGTYIVKPMYSKISPFCTKLTGLTQEQVDKGESFETVCCFLRREFETDKFPWASWGAYDHKAIAGQCIRRGVTYPFGEHHVDLKSLFARLRVTKRIGLGRALPAIGMTFDGRHHSGFDDAFNAARILIWMVPRLPLLNRNRKCGKYLGDNYGTCPQLTCIRDKGHKGNCDNVRP